MYYNTMYYNTMYYNTMHYNTMHYENPGSPFIQINTAKT